MVSHVILCMMFWVMVTHSTKQILPILFCGSHFSCADYKGYCESPTQQPTPIPTLLPSPLPTLIPTLVPSSIPTSLPSLIPTSIPTSIPTLVPTSTPTILPTPKPTYAPPCSERTCEELEGLLGDTETWEWEDSETMGGTVCASRSAPPLPGCLEDVAAPHWEGSTFAESTKHCHDIGARLCTYEELFVPLWLLLNKSCYLSSSLISVSHHPLKISKSSYNGVGESSGCNTNNQEFWTSTPCDASENGHTGDGWVCFVLSHLDAIL